MKKLAILILISLCLVAKAQTKKQHIAGGKDYRDKYPYKDGYGSVDTGSTSIHVFSLFSNGDAWLTIKSDTSWRNIDTIYSIGNNGYTCYKTIKTTMVSGKKKWQISTKYAIDKTGFWQFESIFVEPFKEPINVRALLNSIDIAPSYSPNSLFNGTITPL
jgi:hypothetical protein